LNDSPAPVRLVEQNPGLELYATTFLPAVDTAHGRLATSFPVGKNFHLYVMEPGKPARSIPGNGPT